jgi:hypothetical protein
MSHPGAQRRTIQGDALAFEHLCLAVEWKRVTELADYDMHHHRFGSHATVNRSIGRRRLNDSTLASAASVAWAARHLDPHLAGNNVELLRTILTNLMQRATTAGTFLAVDINNDLEAREVCRQRAAIAVGRLRLPRFPGGFRRVFCVCGCLALGGGLLLILEHELQLIEVEFLRTPPVPMAQQTLDQQPKLIILNLQLMNHLPQHLLQRVGIVGQPRKIDLHMENMFDAFASFPITVS